MSRKILVVLIIIFTLSLPACGGSGEIDAGNPAAAERGETLFAVLTIGDNFAPGCSTCHSLNEGEVIVGPSMFGLAGRTPATISSSGYSGSAANTDDYIRESILAPNMYIVEGYDSGLMHQNYEMDLTPEQLDDLVAYLLTLN